MSVASANPRVTVLMAVFNGERHIEEALDSLFRQSFTDFELLVVDDGSVDSTASILAACRDPRLRLLRIPENMGLTRCLNRGLDEARGAYVARMDADDLSLPHRLAAQYDYMERHPEVGLCGGHARLFGNGRDMVWKSHATDAMLRCDMLFHTPMAHPSFFMRMEMLREAGLRYDESFPCAQDYDFLARCAEHFPLGCVDDVVLHYRLSDHSISGRGYGEQKRMALRVKRRLLAGIGVTDARQVELHAAIGQYEFEESRDFLRRAQELFVALWEGNARHRVYDRECLRIVMAQLWEEVRRAVKAPDSAALFLQN